MTQKAVSHTQSWLNARFSRKADGTYFGHAPIYGPNARNKSERGIVARHIRADVALDALSALAINPESAILDVGCAEGWFCSLAKHRFGCHSEGTDLSEEACKRANEIFGITATPADILDLPFPDKKFDAAVCMETLEHVPDIHSAVAELLRVARAVVITVPNESVRKTTRTHIGIDPHKHMWNFNRHSFDYLKTFGHEVSAMRHTSTLGLCFYMTLEKLGLLSDKAVSFCLSVDRLIRPVPPSWGWLFVIKAEEK
jgi:2-polyprenyl-3-methyl-5-hydroxy-6-metoxy-1,4-benzoquinol methylase